MTLSGQPGAIARTRRRPVFVLTDVDLEVKASDDKDVSLTVVETVVPQVAALRVLSFDLEGTVYTTVRERTFLSATSGCERSPTSRAGSSHSMHSNDELLVQLAGAGGAGPGA